MTRSGCRPVAKSRPAPALRPLSGCSVLLRVVAEQAHGVHSDRALDIRSYCARVESGAESLVAFVRRHPDWPDNRERERINGRVRPGREPWRDTARKLAKQVLASRPATAGLLASARVLEAVAPRGRALPRVYRTLVGAYLFRGYRRGLSAVSDERPR